MPHFVFYRKKRLQFTKKSVFYNKKTKKPIPARDSYYSSAGRGRPRTPSPVEHFPFDNQLTSSEGANYILVFSF
jgi:hypothetical protein